MRKLSFIIIIFFGISCSKENDAGYYLNAEANGKTYKLTDILEARWIYSDNYSFLSITGRDPSQSALLTLSLVGTSMNQVYYEGDYLEEETPLIDLGMFFSIANPAVASYCEYSAQGLNPPRSSPEKARIHFTKINQGFVAGTFSGLLRNCNNLNVVTDSLRVSGSFRLRVVRN